MSKATTPPRLAWEERWAVPTLDQLLDPYDDYKRKLLVQLKDNTEAYEGVTSGLEWHGSSWQWTLQFNLSVNGEERPLAFLVPNPEMPVFCVPLSEDMIAAMPIRRLNRFIREGIRDAKCSVNLYWAKFVPSAGTEVEHLNDLIKRVHKMHVG